MADEPKRRRKKLAAPSFDAPMSDTLMVRCAPEHKQLAEALAEHHRERGGFSAIVRRLIEDEARRVGLIE